MNANEVLEIESYRFSADFATAADEVRLPASQFAALLAEAKAAGAAEAVRQSSEETRETLKACIGDLARLAELLEGADVEAKTKARSEALILRACRRLVDGQGDLFAEP